MLITAAFFVQVFCLCTAAFFWFRNTGHTVAESGSYSIITVFMLLSFVRQLFFIAGLEAISTPVEVFFVITAVGYMVRHRSQFENLSGTLKNLRRLNPISFVFLLVCFLYMGAHTFLHVTRDFQNELAMVGLYEKTGFFPLVTTAEVPALLPLNHLVLYEPYLKAGTGSGVGIPCFLAYLSIGFSTYALARRYAWQPTAFTATVLVLSMPRLVVQAMVPGTQIVSIAVVLFCLLAIYRAVESPEFTDLVLLILGLFFGISENMSGLIFAPILFILASVVFFRRHGMIAWHSILINKVQALFFVLPAFIFSQVWLFWANYLYKETWFATASPFFYNTGGIQGALANFIRYLVESAYFTAPVDLFFERVFNTGLAQPLQFFYNFFVRSFLGESGAAQSFNLNWMADKMFSFGPVAFFLVLPALCYTLLKGPRRLKAVAIAFFSYFYLVCLVFAWTPGSLSFFDVFYVGAGFSMAFFFPPWRFTKSIKKIVQVAGCLLLLITLVLAS